MRRVLDQLVVRIEDDEAYLAVAEDTQLHGLLHQAEAALLERHLTVTLVQNSLDLNLLATHGGTTALEIELCRLEARWT